MNIQLILLVLLICRELIQRDLIEAESTHSHLSEPDTCSFLALPINQGTLLEDKDYSCAHLQL